VRPARRPPSPAVTLAVLGLLAGTAKGQTGAAPSPRPAEQQDDGTTTGKGEAKAKPAPKRLRLDVERHVERRLAQDGDVPRFETRVDVVAKSPQLMLNRFFGGVDLECSPAGAPPGGGAPTELEMREARWHPSPGIDFLALARAIADKLKAVGPDRYFLYRMRTGDDVNYVLREGRLPPSQLYTPGTTYELVDAFPDLSSATRAWRRMERGYPTPTAAEVPPPAAWQTSTCRPLP